MLFIGQYFKSMVAGINLFLDGAPHAWPVRFPVTKRKPRPLPYWGRLEGRHGPLTANPSIEEIVALMKRLILVSLPIILAACCAIQAHGQSASRSRPEERGSWLYHACQAEVQVANDTADAPNGGVRLAESCMSYIRGFMDGFRYSSVSVFCVQDASLGTTIRVYVAHMERYPKLMDENRSVGFVSAMAANYPCSRR